MPPRARSRRPSPSRAGSRPWPSSTLWPGSATSKTIIPTCGFRTTAAPSASRPTRPAASRSTTSSAPPKPMPSSPSSAEREGRVVSGHGRHVVVEADDGRRILCHARGKKSETVVGDRVLWQPSGDEGVVEKVLPRLNLLHRQDAWKTKAFAANLDQLLFVVAAEPVFSESQLARALIAAEAAGIAAGIILNKQDLSSWPAAAARLAPYPRIGIEVLGVALKKEPQEAREKLAPLLAGRSTLVLGPSGAGKSTLVNLLVADAGAQIGEISQALNTGRHTTTATQWYWLDAARP